MPSRPAIRMFDELLPAALIREPARARAIGGRYRIEVRDVATWVVDLSADPPSISRQMEVRVQCTISISEPDLDLVIAHPASALPMLRSGRISVGGNALQAQGLLRLFQLV